MKYFSASTWGETEDNGVYTIGLAENKNGEGKSLLISAEENEFHQFESYDILNEKQMIAFSCLESIVIEDRALQIELNAGGMKNLQLPKRFYIQLDLKYTEIHSLKKSLRKFLDRVVNHRIQMIL